MTDTATVTPLAPRRRQRASAAFAVGDRVYVGGLYDVEGTVARIIHRVDRDGHTSTTAREVICVQTARGLLACHRPILRRLAAPRTDADA